LRISSSLLESSKFIRGDKYFFYDIALFRLVVSAAQTICGLIYFSQLSLPRKPLHFLPTTNHRIRLWRCLNKGVVSLGKEKLS